MLVATLYTSLRFDPNPGRSVSCAIHFATEAFVPIHSNFAPRSNFFTCSICNDYVELESAKIDEAGRPVHEKCYVQKVSLKKSIRPPPGPFDDEHDDHSISQAIITFLDSPHAHAIANSCPVCGSQLVHLTIRFFYAGRTRDVQSAICLECNPMDEDHPTFDT
jgi:hypothetical protein